MSRYFIPIIAAAIGSPFFAASSETAAAEEAVIEEIIVEGEFRQSNVDRLAGSVSVLRPEQGSAAANHLEEVLGRAPNVNYASGASRGRYFQIRGVGERGQFIEPLNPSVGLVVDGVDLSGVGTAATLFDVEQVEIFRGPQGTLYGANALAGLINVVTPNPTNTLTTQVRFDAGEYGALGMGAVVSGPLSERAGFRLSAHQYRDDGFIENDFLGADDTNDRDERTLRAKLDWRGDRSDWRLSVGHVDVDNGYDAFSLENDRHTRSDEPGQDVQETQYATLAATLNLLDSATLEASLGYVESDIEYGYDEDWTFVGFDPWEYSSTDLYSRDVETLTAEARLVSKPGQGLFDGSLDWVLGAYVYDQQVGLRRSYTYLSEDFVSEFGVDRLAIYGELARSLGENFNVRVGARLERHDADYDDSLGVSYRPDDDLVGGRILLERTLGSGAMLYAGVTQGYKTGGFNADGSLDADLREFGDEGLWNVEVGYKGRWLDDRLVVRGALFRMERDDIQIATSIVRVRGDGSAEFIEYTGNAAEGYNQGVEIELAWQATDRLRVHGSLGLLDTQFSDYVAAGGEDLDGRSQAHAPDYQFHLGADYLFGDGWFVTVEVEGKDEFYFSDSHGQKSQAYELVHAAIGYEADAWAVRLWGRNITDEDYFVRGYYFGNDPRVFYEPNLWTQLGAPSQVGVSLHASF
jgi:outer membrane receptor protein involved in Fe transport